MSNSSFTYLPLGEDLSIIRLLRISPGSAGTQLRCTIEHVPFTSDLQYRALSYAWRDASLRLGDEHKASEKLIVNEIYFLLIAKNLAAFLHQIRDTATLTESFWIDAICINQEDIRERNIHVIKMGEVYKKAQNVLVWLGPEQDNSVLAISTIQKIAELGGLSLGAPDERFNFWDASVKQVLQDTIRADYSADASWAAMIELFKRAWWRRTWVVQEVMLAKEFIFMCGTSTLDWKSLWHTLENLWAHSHWVVDTFPLGKDLLRESSAGRTILWMRSNRHKGDRNILQLLYHLRSSQSTDPKDKVYGVLGLASDALQVVPRANYQWSLQTVYATLYETMTDVRKDLDWLTLASGDAVSGWPSWLPDLTKRSRLVSMNTCRSVQAQAPFGFCAAAQSTPVLSIDVSNGRCKVDGLFVDEIDGMGASTSPTNERTLLQPQSAVSAYVSPEDIFTAIWTTLVADQDFEGTESSWRAPSAFGELYAAEGQRVLRGLQAGTADTSVFGTWNENNAEFVIGGKTLAEWTAFPGARESRSNEATHGFFRRLESTVSGRKLFTTTEGYVGIANDSVRRGDKVCLLAGGRMPVIVRRSGECYRFLGESYVHSMMFGERWPIAGKLESFTLE